MTVAITTASAAAVVRRFLRAYGTGDRDAVAALLEPTATICQPAGLPHAGTYIGPDGFWLMVGRLSAAVEIAAASLEVHDVGPGLAQVGATESFEIVNPLGRFVLTVCMLLGRLEIFTVVALLSPSFWRR